jgi:hypothetical protein
VTDVRGDRYIVKLDPPAQPEMATGAEMVCSRIVHALGWNVPEYHLVRIDPARLELGENATTRDDYRRKRPMTAADLEHLLSQAARLADGRVRAVASLAVPGVRKGPFRTVGVRPDDPNDLVPHEDRRELRGLRIVAAWIDYTDARRGNFYDTFLATEADGRGHLVHYLLDFSSALGAGNVGWKSPKDGHEYFIDPPIQLASLLSLGFWVKPWEDPPAPAHPALGYLNGAIFDPEEWRTTYPQPLFDRATARDSFWGAKLVASFREEDLRAVAAAGEWSDPRAADALVAILRERQRKIAALYFDPAVVNPIDRFTIEDGRLRFEDLAVASGVVDAGSVRHAVRSRGRERTIVDIPEVALLESERELELETSHDRGRSWSPITTIRIDEDGGGRSAIVAIERATR